MSTATPYMFAHVPSNKPSLRAAYEAWLEASSPRPPSTPRAASLAANVQGKLPVGSSVGIVGGGMAGLYAGLLLSLVGIRSQIFEADPQRLGGRIFTHFFNTTEAYQYFEAGAMRLPQTAEQQPVFDLIKTLNATLPSQFNIPLITYNLYDQGNLVYVNGVTGGNGPLTWSQYLSNPAQLNFPLPGPVASQTASKLLDAALQDFLPLLEKDFPKGFAKIVQYDDYSLYTYLRQISKWPLEQINYVEVMNSATNQFQNSFTELVIESMDFGGAQWMTIDGGMNKLPIALAQAYQNRAGTITQGAVVQAIENMSNGQVAIHHSLSSSPAIFDAVLLAVPPAALRMIETPQWSPTKMQAIRSMHFEPLYKIGLRFQSRFWEQTSPPSKGGQSTSDLPSRWCVYPSYGIGDNGQGVLLLYSWMNDGYNWLPENEAERERIALRDLQKLYPNVQIQNQFIESFAVAWPNKWATGDAMFFPGQFRTLFNTARAPEGNVFFAGEHLSVHHTWIVGALDSAFYAVQQICGASASVSPIMPPGVAPPPLHTYDYGPAVAQALAEKAASTAGT
jgi:monoamine oxidase